MPRFTDVVVAWDEKEKKVLCDPMVATVYYRYEKGPSAVRWVVKAMPAGAARVEIRWENDSPFRDMGAEILDGNLCVLGAGNRASKGYFKYEVRFLGPGDEVLAALDPGIRNEPEPGGGP